MEGETWVRVNERLLSPSEQEIERLTAEVERLRDRVNEAEIVMTRYNNNANGDTYYRVYREKYPDQIWTALEGGQG